MAPSDSHTTRSVESLATESYVSLATFRKSGVTVETPVWVAPLDGRLVVVTDGTSAKVKRIRANDRVRLAPCDVRGKVLGNWLEGRARIIADREHAERAHAALVGKYGWQMRLLDLGSWVGGRISRRAYLEIGD
jgi:PPOX class probable F420-dependent enzyme